MIRLSDQSLDPKVVLKFVMHSEENLRPDSALRRFAPYRLRYQGEKNGVTSRESDVVHRIIDDDKLARDASKQIQR